jgi:hypothetical protein
LLRGFKSNALPAGPLRLDAIRFELDNAPATLDGDDHPHAQFGRLLNHPIHPLTLEEGLSEEEGRDLLGWSRNDVENSSCQSVLRDFGDSGAIAEVLSVGQEDRLAGLDAQAVTKVREQGACD